MASSDPQTAEVIMLSPEEVKQRIDQGNAYVVDVREPNEFAEARLANTKLVPLSAFNPSEIDPPAGKDLILHCRSARRCGIAAEHLVAQGHTGTIYRMSGGILQWIAEGLPVESG